MSTDLVTCPGCGSRRTRYREHRDDWFCDDCDHRWTVDAAPTTTDSQGPLLFLSYARRDAGDLATRLQKDLEANGYRVWLDRPEIVAGGEWEHQIVDGLRSAQLMVAVLTPSAVRRSNDPTNPDAIDSVCLDEISFARFAQPPTSIVPVMAQQCEPPFSIFRLDYVDMQAWQDSEDQYQAGLGRLLTAIGAALGGKVSYRSTITALQPWDFAAFLYEKRRDFCGREWLFREIDLWLTTNNEPALLITGDPGTGKSALVAELVHRNPGGQVLAYHCCEADVLATVEPARFVRSIAAMIASQLPQYAARLHDPPIKSVLGQEVCERDPFSAFEAGVLTPLQVLRAPDEGVRYLLIDALDESLPRGGSGGQGTIVDLLSTFIERLPGWLRIVATSRKESAVLQRLGGLRAHEIAADDPRNIDDIKQYLRQQLQTPNLSQQLTRGGLSLEDAVTVIRAHADGNFLYVNQVCKGLERGLYSLSDVDELPQGLYAHYGRFFQRQFADSAIFELARPVLEVLVAADRPLPRNVVALACGPDGDHNLSSVLRSLGAFVVYDESGWPEGFRLFHKSLTDWLTDPARDGDVYFIDSDKGRARLIDAILASAGDKFAELSDNMRRTLLWLLVSAGQWDRFYDLIRDFSFVKAFSSSQWPGLYPYLVRAVDESERHRLQPLPLALLDVGRFGDRFGYIPDTEWKLYTYYRAFAAILGLVQSDRTKAPWLLDFLNHLEWMTIMLGHRAIQDVPLYSAYAGYIQEQWDRAINLLDEAGVAVPATIQVWNEKIQTF